MKFFKNKKGFTLVELVVVIAILGILAGIAIPRFMDATASARGAKIVADMRTLDSASTMYTAKNGVTATKALLTANTDYLASWPTPPTGEAKITRTNNTIKTIASADMPAAYGLDANGRATLGDTDTIDVLLAPPAE